MKTLNDSQIIQLKRDVDIYRINDNQLILVGRREVRSLKLSGVACELIPLISSGCYYEDLIDVLSRFGMGNANIRLLLQDFIKKIAQAGVLEGQDYVRKKNQLFRDYYFFNNLDLIAKWASWPLRQIKGKVVLLYLSMFVAGLLIAIAINRGLLLFSLSDLNIFSFVIIIAGVFIWAFLHEVSHVIACGTVGCKVSSAGLRLRRFSFPSPFIDTRLSFLVRNAYLRAWISIAGPLLDVMALALLCAIMFFSPSYIGSAPEIRLLFYLILIGLLCNSNPFRESDMTKAIETLIDRPMFHKNVFRHLKLNKNMDYLTGIYLAWCIFYLLLFLAVMTYFGSQLHNS